MRAALSITLHQPEKCLRFKNVIGSVGNGQGSLESGVNLEWVPSLGSGPASEDLADTLLEMANNTLGF